MNQAPLQNDLTPSKMLDETAAYIASVQSLDGSIAWFIDGSADPWDHIEAAMGLATRGQIDAAKNAYNFLAEQQLANGGWFVSYEQGKPKDTSRIESNFVAYIATGIWHLYLVTDDKTVLATYWPMVSRAMQLVVSLQGNYGEIFGISGATILGDGKIALIIDPDAISSTKPKAQTAPFHSKKEEAYVTSS